MFIAQIQTSTGPMTIGLTDITHEQINASLGALIGVLCELDDPIVVESDEVHLQEAPEDTPATLTFRYLGSGATEFSDLKAYAVWMNESLAVNVYMCATQVAESGDGRLTVDYQSFELQVDDSVDTAPDALH
ncbi:hypothetical protein BH10PSE18_BH10PSE18_50400 [soil metagenome]